MDVSLISVFDGFRGPLRHSTAAGGFDVLDQQDFPARVGEGKIVADLLVEVHRAEIVQGFLKVDLCPALVDVSVAARETHNSQEESQDTRCFDVFGSMHEKGFRFIVF